MEGWVVFEMGLGALLPCFTYKARSLSAALIVIEQYIIQIPCTMRTWFGTCPLFEQATDNYV